MTKLRWSIVALLLGLFLVELLGCVAVDDVLPSTKEQAVRVESKVSDAINEVGELRSTVTNQIRNVQDSAWVWLIALAVISILGAVFPVLALVLIAWLIRKWISKSSYVGQFDEITELKAAQATPRTAVGSSRFTPADRILK